MGRALLFWGFVCSCLVAFVGCKNVDVPASPDVSAFVDAYEHPTATVRSETMDRYGELIEAVWLHIDRSTVLDHLLGVIEKVQAVLDADEDGVIELGAIEFGSPDGVVEIDHCCTGWGQHDDSVDTAADGACDGEGNGTIALTMTIGDGRLEPVVWGAADECQFRVTEGVEVSYDGDVTIHLGDSASTNVNLRELPITFVVTGTIGLDGESLHVDQSLRVSLDGTVEILVRIDEDEEFIYFFHGDREGIRDATGTYSCSLGERTCDAPSGSFSW